MAVSNILNYFSTSSQPKSQLTPLSLSVSSSDVNEIYCVSSMNRTSPRFDETWSMQRSKILSLPLPAKTPQLDPMQPFRRRRSVQCSRFFHLQRTVFWAKVTTWVASSLAVHQAAGGNATLLSSPMAKSKSSQNLGESTLQRLNWTSFIETLDDLQHIYDIASSFAPFFRQASPSYCAMMSCTAHPLPVPSPFRMNVPNTEHTLFC